MFLFSEVEFGSLPQIAASCSKRLNTALSLEAQAFPGFLWSPVRQLATQHSSKCIVKHVASWCATGYGH